MAEIKVRKLVFKTLLESPRDHLSRDGGALLRNRLRLGIADAKAVGGIFALALDLVEDKLLVLCEQLAGTQLLRFCHYAFPRFVGCAGPQRLHSLCDLLYKSVNRARNSLQGGVIPGKIPIFA